MNQEVCEKMTNLNESPNSSENSSESPNSSFTDVEKILNGKVARDGEATDAFPTAIAGDQNLKPRQSHVNPKLVPLKLMYFSVCAGQAMVWPFIANYLYGLGLGFTETATIFGIMPFVGLVFRPLMGFVADKIRGHKVILVICLFLWLTSFECLLYVKKRSSHNSSVTNSSIVTDSLRKDQVPPHDIVESPSLSPDPTFWHALLCLLLVNAAFAPMFAIIDAIVFNMLGENGTQNYGKQRMWATFGFMLFSLIGGIGLQHLGEIDESYWVRIHINTGFCILAAVLVLPLKIDFSKRKTDNSNGSPQNSSLLRSTDAAVPTPSRKQQCLKICTNCKILMFILSIFVFGCLGGYHESYYGLFLQNEIRANQVQMGITMASSTLAEMIIFFFSGAINRRLGHEGCLLLVYASYAFRFLAYAFLVPSPWVTVPVDLFHGLTFGLMWATSASYANVIAPEGMAATLQGIMGGMYYNAGKGVGSLIGGMLYNIYGGKMTFLFLSIAALLSGFLYLTYLLARKKLCKTCLPKPND